MIVVDTSVLVDYLKGRRTAAAKQLERLEAEDSPFFVPAVCCQELLQGARDDREWELLLGHLETQTILHPKDPWRTHIDAARICYDCRRVGLTVRGTLDCYIAQLVLQSDGILLHDDEDFEKISRVRDLRTLRR